MTVCDCNEWKFKDITQTLFSFLYASALEKYYLNKETHIQTENGVIF